MENICNANFKHEKKKSLFKPFIMENTKHEFLSLGYFLYDMHLKSFESPIGLNLLQFPICNVNYILYTVVRMPIIIDKDD